MVNVHSSVLSLKKLLNLILNAGPDRIQLPKRMRIRICIRNAGRSSVVEPKLFLPAPTPAPHIKFAELLVDLLSFFLKLGYFLVNFFIS
jgi:hypothetical protein